MNEFLVLLLAATPLVELRGSIPVGIFLFHITVPVTLALSIVGNMVPVIILLLGLPSLVKFLSKNSQTLNQFFQTLFAKTQKEHSKKVETWGAIALFILTAIPFPLTGAWTASLVAFVFNIPNKKAFIAILLGVVTAGLIISGLAASLIFLI